MRLIEKQPENRYASAAQALAVLAEVAEKEGIRPPEPSTQLPPLPSRSPPAVPDASPVQTVTSSELVSEKELPATSVSLSVSESQLLSENALGKPSGEADTRSALASPIVRTLGAAANADPKNVSLPAGLLTADKRDLPYRLKARLPAALQTIPLLLVLLAPASLLGLLFALLLRYSGPK